VNNPSDVERTIRIAFNLDLLCCAFFALVNWSSSGEEIGAHFLGLSENA
jgi:hypothetical protein